MEDRIAKQRLNVILLVDASKSMQGERIKQVNQAIEDIRSYLIDLQDENSNVDFYVSIIPFSTESQFYQGEKCVNVNDLKFNGIKTGGWSNLHLAYINLEEILHKESKGGIMPDFGGVAPIILLITDGHPTGNEYKNELEKVNKSAWFRSALRYGIAIELKDKRTLEVLHDFVKDNGDVITCYDAKLLKNIIKIIVLTASQVKSTSSNVSFDNKQARTQNIEAKQLIAEALADTENWEW